MQCLQVIIVKYQIRYERFLCLTLKSIDYLELPL
jgi:hypothetical protein